MLLEHVKSFFFFFSSELEFSKRKAIQKENRKKQWSSLNWKSKPVKNRKTQWREVWQGWKGHKHLALLHKRFHHSPWLCKKVVTVVTKGFCLPSLTPSGLNVVNYRGSPLQAKASWCHGRAFRTWVSSGINSLRIPTLSGQNSHQLQEMVEKWIPCVVDLLKLSAHITSLMQEYQSGSVM